ncbi:hypothetical protein SCA6_001367 [Theobroma cacao]
MENEPRALQFYSKLPFLNNKANNARFCSVYTKTVDFFRYQTNLFAVLISQPEIGVEKVGTGSVDEVIE